MAEYDAAGASNVRLHLLVLRCQAGDERAFAQLFEWFGERSLRYLRGLVGDAADDVHQEVWLSVYRTISSLGKPSAFRTWLFSATRHRALDYLRRQKRERELLEGVAFIEMFRGALAGNLPWITVVGTATPLISTLLILSILVATLSTVGVFLRFRSASLTEIQVRLAQLEDMITAQGSPNDRKL